MHCEHPRFLDRVLRVGALGLLPAGAGLQAIIALSASTALAANPDNNVEWNGIFSDTTADFVSPPEFAPGDTIAIRLRSYANDLTGAKCHIWYVGSSTKPEERVAMTKGTSPSGSLYDVWTANIQVPRDATHVYYQFDVIDGTDTDYYDAGASTDSWLNRGMSDTERSFLSFKLVAGFSTPDWSKQAVFYQIFPDRFYNGDTSNDKLFPDDCYWYLDYAPALYGKAECQAYPTVCTEVQDKKCAIHASWDETPNGGPCDFYGGDLKGVEDRLDYIKALGATAIYLNPIFRSPSNHKYDIMDYTQVDPRFGGNTAASSLSRAVDAANLYFILDGVFNHESDLGMHYNGWSNYAYNNGAVSGYDSYSSSYGAWEEFFLNVNATNWTDVSSDYSDWFKTWNGTDKYDVDCDDNTTEPAGHNCGWAGMEFMPDIDYKASTSSEPRTWLYGGTNASSLTAARQSIAGKWTTDGAILAHGTDGWRLDVPDSAGYFANSATEDCSKNTHIETIWDGFYTATKTVDAENYVVGELWNDASNDTDTSPATDWTDGEFDGAMNYHYFAMPISCFVTGWGVHHPKYENGQLVNECDGADYAAMKYGSSTSVDALDAHLAKERRVYPSSFYLSSQNLLSSHDTTRFFSRTGNNYAKLAEAVYLQATLPGAPMVYYGDEVAVEGTTNEFGRAPFPWYVIDDPETYADETGILDLTSRLMCLRTSYPALQTGSFITLHTNNTDRTYGFGRFDDTDRLVVLINNDGGAHTIRPDVSRLDITNGTVLVNLLDQSKTYTVTSGVVSVTVSGNSGVILAPADRAYVAACCDNLPPTADAGPDQDINEGQTLLLDGSKSSDPDGDALSYLWTDSNGMEVGTSATITLADLPAGEYTYTLTVDDGCASDTDEVNASVSGSPTCAGSDSRAPLMPRYGFLLALAPAGALFCLRRRANRSR